MKLLLLPLLIIPLYAHAQCPTKAIDREDVFKKIAAIDSCFFATAYSCDAKNNRHLFTDDLEFYHDVTGVTHSAEEFMDIVNKNFCETTRKTGLKRLVKAGSMSVFPLYNNGTVYGAVQYGEHYFYEVYSDSEKRVGLAKFTHVWVIENGSWKISRILSYDHQPSD
ncbi:MAG: nuclear transport factor 2 family protein [Flammeovirgaceae bacterium]|nr:nuclear transport factor 2 family protein [Flammeovirgaceae bacterium]